MKTIRPTTMLLSGALALFAASCEILAGIESVIDARDAGKGGGSEGCPPLPDAGCEAGCSPSAVIAGLDNPIGVAVYDGVVYAAAGNEIAREEIGKGQLQPLSVPEMSAAVELVAADASGVYWTYPYTYCLGHVPLDGKTPKLLGACEGTFFGKLALGRDDVVWAVSAEQGGCASPGPGKCCAPANTHGCIMKVPKQGGPVTTLAESVPGAFAVAVTDEHVYWGTWDMAALHGEIVRCPLQGCTGAPEVVEPEAGNVIDLNVDGDHVYWFDSQMGKIKRKPLAGGEVEVLHLGTYYGGSFTVDDTYVTWTDAAQVYRVPKGEAFSPVTTLGGAHAEVVATDCAYVYWSERSANGAVMRVAR